MVNSCLLCGVGGQGTVLASKLIAYAAMKKDMQVRTAETIGMAQRGGCVVSHVRIGQDIASPLIPLGGADVMLAFEPGEAVRCLPYLKSDATVVVNSKCVQPVTASLSDKVYLADDMLSFLEKNVRNLVVIDGERICAECGSPKVLNIALLAAAAHSGKLSISVDELKSAIIERISEKFHALNLKAVELACK